MADIISSEYGVSQSFYVVSGAENTPALAGFLTEVLDLCAKAPGYVDLQWINYLLAVIRDPSPGTVEAVRSLLAVNNSLLEPFAIGAEAKRLALSSPPGAIFITLDGVGFGPGQPLWGGCIDEYPQALAAETTGQRESLFHECLHIFGISEGYEEESKATILGCESCWMQWEATRGRHLCSRHQDELRSFLADRAPAA